MRAVITIFFATAAFLLAVALPGPAYCGSISIGGKEEAGLDAEIQEGLRLLNLERFDEAQRMYEKIKDRYPDHPIGYFLVAAALESRMIFYFSSFKEQEFYKNCDKAIEIGENIMIKRPDDLWNMFFLGGAYGIKGTYESRYKRYITAFRNGWTGVSLLKQIHEKDSTIVDVLYGLGTYYYWSSKLSKTLWWMPGVGDKRELGISQLKRVNTDGHFSREAAANVLVDILIEEKRYNEAADLARVTLKQFPNNRTFTFGLAEALFYQGNNTESEKIFRYIMDTADSEEFNNSVNSLKCRLFLAKIYERTKVFYRAAAECRRGIAYRFNETDKIIADECISEMHKILKNVNQYLRK
ncbi:MAG: hypothetical protein A2487_06155 [Candidatus Raymondbacteria bacterium RifOxyC12_full_50_8]|uniref:Outer membrane lipoprotein BamD-like domain-containing protein n=1 Tax=Candidatus Raymondbacteria bacterium RIFOXYD12_FULL_49_13 TaxID=1817890 RepID=A0A1F7F9G4_UNCRA|nr:MAG: hypothetical protein A2248_18590 [Candidatus Raymondbacteria bacterium RIFOXYA2_FULL_49_16]OGJ98601.1 MAG: hypothetical protein A2350_14195 [Candidatus Raymondbacteria bacterium RifOxyB12_full_50_8]OGJ99485.1 MAG: hypothetical protein A2487_06155 [Candidatus Raymondbacteria bacterium RifOxyC12_full_50_8]OGK03273.1 MAG: hypothetical protein A2519_13175 [Candidatus Raymondbacteria bacterium RIFOXYD12_FULL_49_13]OGP41546.1 MAG: hypothetical protein A2324_09695 [Candidatus Raymondbacteria b